MPDEIAVDEQKSGREQDQKRKPAREMVHLRDKGCRQLFYPGQKPTDAPIENEANNGLKNDNYTVAMARTQAPHSATAQFFINVADNAFLNHTAPSMQGWGYAVFGKVVAGTDVVDKIKAVKTGRKGFHDDVPNEDVVIEKAVVV